MKRPACLPLIFAACLTAGCSSNAHLTTPKVALALEGAKLGLNIDRVRASTHWSSSNGHGPGVIVKAKRPRMVYVPKLNLELADAAKVCAALAGNEFVQEWDFLSVLFVNDYGRGPPDMKPVVGVVEVIVERESLIALTREGAPTQDHPQRWVSARGFKDQLDSELLQEW